MNYFPVPADNLPADQKDCLCRVMCGQVNGLVLLVSVSLEEPTGERKCVYSPTRLPPAHFETAY